MLPTVLPLKPPFILSRCCAESLLGCDRITKEDTFRQSIGFLSQPCEPQLKLLEPSNRPNKATQDPCTLFLFVSSSYRSWSPNSLLVFSNTGTSHKQTTFWHLLLEECGQIHTSIFKVKSQEILPYCCLSIIYIYIFFYLRDWLDGKAIKGTCYKAWWCDFDSPRIHMMERENQHLQVELINELIKDITVEWHMELY